MTMFVTSFLDPSNRFASEQDISTSLPHHSSSSFTTTQTWLLPLATRTRRTHGLSHHTRENEMSARRPNPLCQVRRRRTTPKTWENSMPHLLQSASSGIILSSRMGSRRSRCVRNHPGRVPRFVSVEAVRRMPLRMYRAIATISIRRVILRTRGI